MKKISTLFACFLSAFLFCCNGFGQPTVSWVARYNGSDNKMDDARKMVLDAWGNVYVTGTSQNKSGSITYITTVKYNSESTQKWVASYTGPLKGDNYPYGLTTDAKGNVYVTGRSMGNNSSYDIATIKYDSSGVQQWVARYNGTGNLNDVPGDLKVDTAGNVYVTGLTDGKYINSGDAIVTLKYNTTGDQKWIAKYDQLPNGTGTNNEQGNSLAVDGSGNIYITGTSGGMVTVKYNPSDPSGQSEWVRNIGNAEGRTVLIDGGNNVVVSGFSPKIVKYDANGNLLWQTNASNTSAAFWDMVLDESGNVFVTGDCTGSNGHSDYITGKFSSGGTERWLIPFNGSLNDIDFARSIALDGLGNVYVTGRCSVNNGTRNGGVNYGTVKYTNDGVWQWVQLYDSPDKSGSDAFDVVTDPANNIYVTGQSATKSTSSDFATIKYAQGSSPNSMATVLANKPAANFSLHNYPNPFYQTTTIEYQLPKEGKVKLTIYDFSGNKIASLIDQLQTAGTHTINFKAGKLLPGTYYYRIESGEYSETKKFIILK